MRDRVGRRARLAWLPVHPELIGLLALTAVLNLWNLSVNGWATVRVFGLHPLSILVLEALMGVAAVALIYDLTRRKFGRVAGAVAGLAFAVTPITVAIARHNNPDELLILCCVAALWCAVRALESGRTRWLVLSGVCVGLGFETKMGVALLVVPGIALAWMWMRWGDSWRRVPGGSSRSAGPSSAPRPYSATRPGSSTRTTSRFWPRSRPPWWARVPG